MLNKTNALDISYVRYKEQNIFLSKNGLNTIQLTFIENFEGIFLYTCGLDNISTYTKNTSIHVRLNNQKAKNINIHIMA